MSWGEGPRIRLAATGAGGRAPVASMWSYCGERCKMIAVLRLATSAEPDEKPRSGAVLARGSGRGSDVRRAKLALVPNERGARLRRRGTCVLVTLKVAGVGLEGQQLALLRYGRRCKPEPPFEP